MSQKPKTEENKVTQKMEEHNITFKGTIKMLHGLLQKLQKTHWREILRFLNKVSSNQSDREMIG